MKPSTENITISVLTNMASTLKRIEATLDRIATALEKEDDDNAGAWNPYAYPYTITYEVPTTHWPDQLQMDIPS